MLRRRGMPTELAAAYDAFLAVLEELEPAKAALTEVLPGTRSPGRPLPDALAAFEAGLTRADARMPGWRTDALGVAVGRLLERDPRLARRGGER